MFKRTRKYTIGANESFLILPTGTHKTADISVMSDGAGAALKFTQNVNDPRRLDFPSSPSARKVIITITQEYPFNPDHLQKFAPRAFTFNQSYEAGEMVTAYGGLYICDKNYVIGNVGSAFSIRDLRPLSYPVGTIQYTPLDTLGEGWYRCDGSVINAPYSSLHGYTSPDLRDKYATGGYYNNNIAAGGTMGRYLGTNTVTMDVRHLPTNSFNVSISGDSSKIAYLNTYLTTPSDASGDPDGALDTNGSYPRAYWRGINYNNSAYVQIPAHGHSGSVQLNTQSQLAMENRPASAVLNAFIRL